MILRPQNMEQMVDQLKALPEGKRKVIVFAGKHMPEGTLRMAVQHHKKWETHGVAVVRIPPAWTPHGAWNEVARIFEKYKKPTREHSDGLKLQRLTLHRNGVKARISGDRKAAQELIDESKRVKQSVESYRSALDAVPLQLGEADRKKVRQTLDGAMSDVDITRRLEQEGFDVPVVHLHGCPINPGFERQFSTPTEPGIQLLISANSRIPKTEGLRQIDQMHPNGIVAEYHYPEEKDTRAEKPDTIKFGLRAAEYDRRELESMHFQLLKEAGADEKLRIVQVDPHYLSQTRLSSKGLARFSRQAAPKFEALLKHLASNGLEPKNQRTA